MKALIVKMASRYYWSAKRLFTYKLRRQDQAKLSNPVIVFTMGKVGSTSVGSGLKKFYHDSNVYHCHYLTDDRVNELEDQRRHLFNTDQHKRLARVWRSQYLNTLIKVKAAEKSQIKVITLVRDPLARNIADFFQHLRLSQVGDKYRACSLWYGFDFTFSIDDVQIVIDNYFKHFRHTLALKFFDEEFRPMFGHDVYSRSFPTDEGFDIFESETSSALVMRLESLSMCGAPALEKFLGLSNMKMPRANVAEDKIYSDLYSKFKKQIRLSDAYLDEIYGSKLARHFYSEGELAEFRKKWLR